MAIYLDNLAINYQHHALDDTNYYVGKYPE